ncbi:MAG: hypothetical protein IIB53_15295 [Planctomycetes bacterium]|nr:hypothetical protein [Planctomycetota bacterium]MCH8260259.1 hypothetical protein [Planctomycetota bacterium]
MMTALSSIQFAALQLGMALRPLREPLWSGQGKFLVAGLVIAMALAVVAVGVLSLVRHDQVRQGPTMRRLCRALGLDTPQRRLLEQLAGKTDVRCPAALLISRGCFDTAHRRYRPQGVELQQLNRIRRRVFDR